MGEVNSSPGDVGFSGTFDEAMEILRQKIDENLRLSEENENLKKENLHLKETQTDLNKTILNLSVRPEKEVVKQIDTSKNDLWGDIEI